MCVPLLKVKGWSLRTAFSPGPVLLGTRRCVTRSPREVNLARGKSIEPKSALHFSGHLGA